jgi:hypothetical protein
MAVTPRCDMSQCARRQALQARAAELRRSIDRHCTALLDDERTSVLSSMRAVHRGLPHYSRNRTSRLANPLGDDPCPVAAFARLIASLTRLLVYLLAGSLAVRAGVLASAWRAGLRIIIGGVGPSWILRMHGPRPILHWRTGGRKNILVDEHRLILPSAVPPVLTPSHSIHDEITFFPPSSKRRTPSAAEDASPSRFHIKPYAARSYHPRERRTIWTTESITGTSTRTPTTVASATPDWKPNREIESRAVCPPEGSTNAPVARNISS